MQLDQYRPIETLTDWQRLRGQTDADIARAVEADADAAPMFTAEDMASFTPTPPRRKR